MTKAIGGYYELELQRGEHYHNALRLNTARNCLEYILRARDYKSVWIPYYTCSVIYEPLDKCGITYKQYHINEYLEPTELPELQDNEAFLYTNYFGLKQAYIKRISSVYGERLIIDNAQAFFATPIEGIDTFYSARKFLGVPDGAYLYTTAHADIEIETNISWQRMQHLLLRADRSAEEGYRYFQQAEEMLSHQPIRKMSNLTDKLLRSINYEDIIAKRRTNYAILHSSLKGSNKLLTELNDIDVPMAYPLLTNNGNIRQKLADEHVYIPIYWPDMRGEGEMNDIEKLLQQHLCALPISQHYGHEDMQRIIEIIEQYD